METLGISGFVLLLAGWFGMFFRVRRDHPGHALSDYRNYMGPRLFGVKIGRTALSLIPFYWRHYGMDVWFSVSAIGFALLAIAIIAWSR